MNNATMLNTKLKRQKANLQISQRKQKKSKVFHLAELTILFYIVGKAKKPTLKRMKMTPDEMFSTLLKAK